MSKENHAPLPIGGSSLLTIFAVLCLLTFSLLSLSTARADKSLSDKAEQSISDYYKADAEAEEILGQLRSGEVPEDVIIKEKTYSYECDISDTRKLCVEVFVEGEEYQILQWKEVTKVEWEADESLNVWDGVTIE